MNICMYVINVCICVYVCMYVCIYVRVGQCYVTIVYHDIKVSR